MLAGALLRVLAVTKPLYIDEIMTITVASQPLAGMARVMRQIDASPALYPLLLHLWLKLGSGDAWARGPSVVFGIATVPVVYLLAKRCFDEKTGLWAAAVAAFAPAHIHYAQYVRGYSLFTFLAGVHLLLLLRWFGAGGGRVARPGAFDFAVLVGVTTALLYTHYLSMLIFPAEGLYALASFNENRQTIVRWAAAVALAGLLFIPGIPLLFHNLEFDRIRNEDRPSPSSLVSLVPNLVSELSVGQQWIGFDSREIRRPTLAAAAVVFPVLLLAGCVAGWRYKPRTTGLLILFALLPLIVYIGSGRKLVAVRFFLPFMLGYIALLGHGLRSFKRPALQAMAAAALGIVCAIPLAHFYRSFQWSYDHTPVARAIAARWQPGDVLMFVQPYESFYYRWYMGPRYPMQGLVFTALEDQGGYVIKPPYITLDVAAPRAQAAARSYDRMFVVGQSLRSFVSDPVEEKRVFDWMDHTFQRVDDLSALTGGDPIVRLYATKRGSNGA